MARGADGQYQSLLHFFLYSKLLHLQIFHKLGVQLSALFEDFRLTCQTEQACLPERACHPERSEGSQSSEHLVKGKTSDAPNLSL